MSPRRMLRLLATSPRRSWHSRPRSWSASTSPCRSPKACCRATAPLLRPRMGRRPPRPDVALYFLGLYDPPRPRGGSSWRAPCRRRRAPGLSPHGLLLSRQPLVPALGPAALYGPRSGSPPALADRPRPHRTAPGKAGRDPRAGKRRARSPAPFSFIPATVCAWPATSRCRRAESDPDPDSDAAADLGPCLGTPEDLPALLASGRIEDIILAGSGDSWQAADRFPGRHPAGPHQRPAPPRPFESPHRAMRYRWVHDLPLIEVVRESECG